MTINCDSIRKICASNPDEIVVLIEEYEETIADEKARNTILEEQNRELKERIRILKKGTGN